MDSYRVLWWQIHWFESDFYVKLWFRTHILADSFNGWKTSSHLKVSTGLSFYIQYYLSAISSGCVVCLLSLVGGCLQSVSTASGLWALQWFQCNYHTPLLLMFMLSFHRTISFILGGTECIGYWQWVECDNYAMLHTAGHLELWEIHVFSPPHLLSLAAF